MPLRFRSARPDEARMLLLARDARVVSATRAAARGLERLPPVRMPDGTAVLNRLFSASAPPQQIVCQPSAVGADWHALLATATDPFGTTEMVLVGNGPGRHPLPEGISATSLTWASANPVALAQALRQAAANRRQVPTDNPEHLVAGLRRGEIVVRYQPIVRIADRRPVLLEGLARWHRRDDTPLSPDAFVPMAERHGMGRALSIAVAGRAFTEMATAGARIGATLSLNLPLNVLVERDMLSWLRPLQAQAGLPTTRLVLEMTETTPVLDRSTLHRALRRLRNAGLAVLIDDLGLDDDRGWLLALPFAGIKLDRHLIGAMPRCGRARREVSRLVRMAHAAGMTVTAEGVSDGRLWRAVAAAGVDHAQGYAIARPLPAAALPAWHRAWREMAIPSSH